MRVEPGGLVNVVRRDGRTAAGDQRGRQDRLRRRAEISTTPAIPKLGMVPWPGGFTAWHEPPEITMPAGSRIRDGPESPAELLSTRR